MSIHRSQHIQGASQEAALTLPPGLKRSSPRGQIGVAFLSFFRASFQKDETLDALPIHSISNFI